MSAMANEPAPEILTWHYHNIKGQVVARKLRIPLPEGGKTFRPQSLIQSEEEYIESEGRCDREGTRAWAHTLRPDLKGLIYRLPQVRKAIRTGAERIYWCEGERDADAVVKAGEVATTSIQNGGHWEKNASWFKGYKGIVVVVADNDAAGAAHAVARYDALRAIRVNCILRAPAPDRKDVRDHLEAGLALSLLREPSTTELRKHARAYDPSKGQSSESVKIRPLSERRTGSGIHAVTEDEETEGSLFFDVKKFLSGEWTPTEPKVMDRTDGHAMFYKGHVNMLFGLPDSGKTWIALAAEVEGLANGGKVAFLDLDHNGPGLILPHLLQLGADRAVLGDPDRFRYVEPEDPAHLRELVASLCEWAPDVVIVDSIGELVPMLSGSSNSADDYTEVNAEVLKPMAKAGSCVIGIDHANKDPETHAYGPTGTQAKQRSISGAMYLVKVERTYIMGQGGASTVINTKDRPGGVKPYCRKNLRNKRQLDAGLFELEPNGDDLAARWLPPSGSDPEAVTDDDQQLCDWLEAAGVDVEWGRDVVWENIGHRTDKPKGLAKNKIVALQKMRKEAGL